MKKRILFLAAITAISMLSGCSPKTTEEASVQSVSMICGIGSTGLSDRFSGVVSPRSQTEIKKDDEQVISEVKVKVGDKVKKKQVLFTYDMEQTQLNLDKANLELEQLTSTVNAQKKEKASLEKERASASKDQKLSYTLEIQEAETAILEGNYNISAKKKEIEKLKNTLKNLKVTSPVKGQVQSINADGAMDNMGNPLPYMTIVETGSCRIKGYINENNASALGEGTPVLVRSRLDDTTWKGTISVIEWNTPEESNNNNMYYDGGSSDETTTSSKYPFYVELEDDKGLLMGQHVYIEPDYGQDEETDETLLQLPAVYLNDADSSAWVWAQDADGNLEKRTVTLGEYNEDMDTYPIEDGLSAEDYIAFPDENLKEGMTCVPYDENTLQPDANGSGDNTDIDNSDDNSGGAENGGMENGNINNSDTNNGSIDNSDTNNGSMTQDNGGTVE